MKQLTRKCASLLLVLCLLAALAVPAAWAEPGEVAISSVEELLAFAKNCSLDTWSRGKTVRLAADLDLSGREFTPIPTFGGTFLGEGHKITGLRVTAAGSNIGLFRYLQDGAVVQDLDISGTVRPGGSAANVGGIVGDNAGAVRNCSFSGTVEGSNAVGGVTGVNRETGEIALCTVSGTVTGEEATGGTAGRNLGTLLQCENMSSVNTNTPDADTGVDMESLTLPLEDDPKKEDGGGFLKNHSDTGGIAGYSSGLIYSCVNAGAVGYPHVGYNVGGIAGRQCGHLSGCANRGAVYGRKDVGGVVGQAEPDVAFSADSGALDRLRRELDILDSLISRAIDRAEGNGDDVSARLSGIGRATGTARDHTEDLLNRLSDFTDDNIGSINSLSATITKALDDLAPALDELSGVSGRMEILADRLEEALEALGRAAEGGGGVTDDASRAAGIFRRAGDALSEAVRDLGRAVGALKSAVVIHDQEAVESAAADLARAMRAFATATAQAVQAMEGLHSALEPLPDLGQVRTILKEQMIPALIGMGAAYLQAESALGDIGANTGLDWGKILVSLREAGVGFRGLESAFQRLNEAIGALQDALGSMGALSGRLGSAIRELADAAALAAPVGRGLEKSFGILGAVTERLAEDGPTQFTPIGEATREAGRGLFDSLSDLSGQLEELHGAVLNAGDQLSADLRAIGRQFNTVFETLLDALADARDSTDNGARELLEDTSDENIAATLYGKIESCRNEGAVDGDRNVGGVVGAMSIEYDLDPEDDLELSFGGTYETKAVLQGSVNRGSVTAKKDCAGGLAGRMDLGTALGCENYGPVASASGSYVGGIAGYADAVVRESFAKCALSGANDVGGIAGWADRMRNCYAIATVLEGTERVGAVAGSSGLGGVRDNFFIDTGLAGIDGVSYTGSAQPITFEELRALPDIPAEFAAFTLSLLADGKTVKEIPFTYGQDLSKIELPAVPEREGFYGEWPEFDTSGLNSDILLDAVYKPWVTLVASGEQEGKLALALAEGQFTEEAALRVQASSKALAGAASSAAPKEDAWDIVLTGTDLGPEDEVPLRLLNRMDGKAAVRQYQDGQWVQVQAEANGRYLLVTMQGTSGTFQIAPAQGNGLLLAVLLAAAVVFAMLAVIRIRKWKRGKGKK